VHSYKKLGISLLLPFIAACIGTYYTTPAIPTWYQALQKPFFTPPNWIFGPVWTLLYLLMGLSLYLVWKTPVKKVNKQALRSAIVLFGFQLICNTLWSIVFFGLQSPELGLLVIAMLWALIFATIWKFYAFNKTASYLLVPYILWVSFASFLNLYIVVLN
jgi:benzodiazapine receptor